MQKYTGNHKS